MWLDCLTVRCVRSEDQPRTRHPRLTSLHRRSLHPLLRSEQLPAGVGGTVRDRGACAAASAEWCVGVASCCRPSALVDRVRAKPTYLPFPSALGPSCMARSCTDLVRVLVPFHDLSAFHACTCRGSRAVDSICHDAWSSWIAGGFMKSSALGRARAAATCADDGPLSLGLLSWLCVACDAARGTREGLAARRMRDRLALPCWQSCSARPAARG